MAATLADIQAKYGGSVYPLYKDQMHEPYMENDNGNGYKGVILYDELEKKTQCAICAKWYEQLGVHVVRSHKYETSNQYKNELGIANQVPICSPSMSNKYSKIIQETRKKGKLNGRSNTTYKKKDKRIKTYAKKAFASIEKYYSSMTYKNKKGLCDAQIATRLIIARDMLKKNEISEIKPQELLRVDKGLYNFIRGKYDSIANGAEALGIAVTHKTHYLESELIVALRNYVIKNRKMPIVQDKKGLPDNKPFIRVFGSWRRAKMMAGLDQLLEEVKSGTNKVTKGGDN